MRMQKRTPERKRAPPPSVRIYFAYFCHHSTISLRTRWLLFIHSVIYSKTLRLGSALPTCWQVQSVVPPRLRLCLNTGPGWLTGWLTGWLAHWLAAWLLSACRMCASFLQLPVCFSEFSEQQIVLFSLLAFNLNSYYFSFKCAHTHTHRHMSRNY